MKGKLLILQCRRLEIWDKLAGPSWYKDDLWKLMDRPDSGSKIYMRILSHLIEKRFGGRSINVSSTYCRQGIRGFHPRSNFLDVSPIICQSQNPRKNIPRTKTYGEMESPCLRPRLHLKGNRADHRPEQKKSLNYAVNESNYTT